MLSAAQVAQWREQGYTLARGLVHPDRVAAAEGELAALYPPDAADPVQGPFAAPCRPFRAR